MPLPAGDLRSNQGTYAVPTCLLPAVARSMAAVLPAESFDPDFTGQDLETTYFDTRQFVLRKVRRSKDRYLVLRVRCYQPSDTYALSAKTEAAKFRDTLDRETAHMLLEDGIAPALYDLFPPAIAARIREFAGNEPLVPVVTTRFKRYAVENANDRLTLDVDITTDTGKAYSCHVLEYKSAQGPGPAPIDIKVIRPIKMSKFLWATS